MLYIPVLTQNSEAKILCYVPFYFNLNKKNKNKGLKVFK